MLLLLVFFGFQCIICFLSLQFFSSVLFLPIYVSSVSGLYDRSLYPLLMSIYHAALTNIYFSSTFIFGRTLFRDNYESYISNSCFLSPLFSNLDKNYQIMNIVISNSLSKRHFCYEPLPIDWFCPYKFGSIDISTIQSRLLISTKRENNKCFSYLRDSIF